MANRTARLDVREFQPEDEIDELFSRGNPNPTRTGCPRHDVLVAASRKKLPIGDPAYEHLANCSPCYGEFRKLQQSAHQSVRRLSGRAAFLAAAAAVVLIAAGSIWLLRPGERSGPRTPSDVSGGVPAAAQPLLVDLRNYSVSRTDQQTPKLEPVQLGRGSMDVTILLPVGSEPGRYDVQLLDSTSRVRVSATGQAEIKNFVTTLRATMDLRSVSPGVYKLALRHEGDDWRLFPASIEQ
jgi:hypothetical protein